MYINTIFLESYGKFFEQRIQLDKGLNIVYGKNEDGKSTVRSFISYLLMSLQYPYLKDSIKEMFGNYQPFDSDEFKGYLLCNNLDNNTNGKIKVYQDFNKMDGPLLVDEKDQEIQISSEEIDVISFKELQGSNGKDLLIDILNRIEKLKTSNLYGVGAKEVITSLEIKLEEAKKELIDLKNSNERNEARDFFANYDIKKAQYRQLSKEYYQLIKKISDEKELVESMESEVESAIEAEAIWRYKQVTEIDSKINQIDVELADLKEYFDANMDEAESDLKDKKIIEAQLSNIEEMKSKYMSLGEKLRTFLNKRSHQDVLRLTNPENISIAREASKTLIERHEEVLELIRSIKAYELQKNKGNCNGLKFADNDMIIKDYYRYNNLINYSEMIKEKVEILNDTVPDSTANKGTVIKRNLCLGGIALSFITLGTGVALYTLNQQLLYLIIMGGGLGLLLIFSYFYTKSVRILNDYNNKYHKNRAEYGNCQEIIYKNNEKVQAIIMKYKCENGEEFQEICTTIKEYRSVYDDIDRKIQEGTEILNRRKYGLTLSRSKLEQIDREFNINLLSAYEKPYQLRDMLENYIDEASKYLKIVEQRQKLQQKIKLKETEHTLFLKNNRKKNLEDSKVIEAKSKGYQLLKHDRDKLIRQRQEALNGANYEELKSLVESIDNIENPSRVFDNVSNEDTIEKIRVRKEMILAIKGELNRVKLALEDHISYLNEERIKQREELIYKESKKHIENRIEFLSVAIDTIKGTSESISNVISETIENKVSEIVFQITKKYSKVKFNEDMNMIFYNEVIEEWKPVSQLSLGTIDQIYLALRLSIVELFQGKNTYPLIFDDSFIQYDRKRLANVMAYLSTLNRQIIVLSCHRREEKAADALGLTYNAITLS